MAGEIYIADKATLDLVKTDTTTLKADTALLKTAAVIGATYGDILPTQTTDGTTLVANLTGKYELLGVQNINSSVVSAVTIQIDGATNRKIIMVDVRTFINLAGLGIKSNTSLKIYADNASCSCIYRLLP